MTSLLSQNRKITANLDSHDWLSRLIGTIL